MKKLNEILYKTIVAEYFRQNVVFYAAILFFAGGMLRANEHIELGKLIVASKTLMFFTFLLWFLHTIKVTLFTIRLLNTKNYEFLFHLRLFSLQKRFFLLSNIQFSLILPTFIYSLFLIYLAFTTQNFASIFYIILINAFFIFGGVWFYDLQLKKPNTESKISASLTNILPKFRTLPYFFYVRYIISKQPVLFLLSLLWGVFVLNGVCQLYFTDDYDERLLAIGGLFVVGGIIPNGQFFFDLEFSKLSFIRNLPISIFQRFSLIVFSFFLTFIPFALTLFRNIPSDVGYLWVISLLCSMVSINTLIYLLNFINFEDTDNYWKTVFMLIIVFFVLIMFKVNVLFMAMLNFAWSYFIYQKRYFITEYQPKKS